MFTFINSKVVPAAYLLINTSLPANTEKLLNDLLISVKSLNCYCFDWIEIVLNVKQSTPPIFFAISDECLV